MSGATPWSTLGIERTDDVAAIRSAYARTLKRIDMDADPQSYIALREARDHAVALARQTAQESAEPAVPETATASPAPAEPVVITLPAADFDTHLDTLTALLVPGENGEAPGPVDAALLRAHLAALIADPQMEEIGFHTRAEARLAHLVAMTLPRSEPLTAAMIAAFGWTRPVRVDTPPAVAAILDAEDAKTGRQVTGIDTARAPSFRAPESTQPPADTKSDTSSSGATPEADDAQFYADRYNALVALLFPQDENAPPLTPGEQAVARGHLAELLADPRMELVGFRVGAESQLAQLIAHGVPRSDCVITTAVEFFEWGWTDGQIDQDNAVAFILDRHRQLRFLSAVQSPSHEFHYAWIELTTPVTKGWKINPAADPIRVRHLLATIRAQQPLLERQLDPDRVEMWETGLANPGGGGSKIPVWAILVLILFVLPTLSGLVMGIVGGPAIGNQTAPYSAPLAATESDRISTATVDSEVQPVLVDIGGDDLTMTTIRIANPVLTQKLEASWREARDDNASTADFRKAAEKIVLDEIATIILNTNDGDMVLDYTRGRLAELKSRVDQAPGECIELASPGKVAVADVPINFSSERKERYRRILEQGYLQMEARPRTVVILDDQDADAIAKKLGSSRLTARSFLSGQGTLTDQCRAHIAEFEMLLDKPTYQSIPILKSL